MIMIISDQKNVTQHSSLDPIKTINVSLLTMLIELIGHIVNAHSNAQASTQSGLV